MSRIVQQSETGVHDAAGYHAWDEDTGMMDAEWRHITTTEPHGETAMSGTDPQQGAAAGPPKSYYEWNKDKDMMDAEWDYIRESGNKKDSDVEHLNRGKVGLALSGGGIRSAVFSLGVMQAMAREHLFEKVDYLSTASGGGYIGSSLTWFLRKGKEGKFDTTKNGFPFGTRRRGTGRTSDGKMFGGGNDQASVVRYIRQARNFLFPGRRIGPLSLFSVVFRGMFLNFVVFMAVLGVVFRGWRELDVKVFPDVYNYFQELLSYALPKSSTMGFAVACIIAALYLVGTMPYYLATLARRWPRYTGRRYYEMYSTIVLICVIVFLVLGSLPVAEARIGTSFSSGGLTLVGIAVGIWSFVRSRKTGSQKIPIELVAGVGSLVLLYGLVLAAYGLAGMSVSWAVEWQIGGLIAAVAITVVLGFLAGLNYLTVHRYYRDRLMETFLPNLEAVIKNETAPATNADEGLLKDMGRCPGRRRPYHLINTNVVLVNSLRTKYRTRGGDNFILSPLFCGSRATGWVMTERFAGGKVTLADAMAASGAAVNPDTGAGGEGPTRSPLLSILMTLLNLRLGYWGPNPVKYKGRDLEEYDPRPRVLRPGLSQVLRYILPWAARLDEEGPFVQLTDGGHYENLAIYELIRRKARVIFVCDGVADPNYTFSDFGNVLEKIRVDFGAKIEIDLKPLVPQCEAPRPKKKKLAKSGHVVGRIAYADGSTGYLIYITTTLIDGLPEDVYSYAEHNPSFPDQTTADQFFDEKQFEAYRELGYQLGHRAVCYLREPHECADASECKEEPDVWAAEVYRLLGNIPSEGGD